MLGERNCFFRALSDQLCGSQQGHHILRVIVTRYLCQHRVEFEEYIDREQF